MKIKILKLNKGFTLVELLIVIAIIGVLASLLMVNFVGIRQRARDAQRKSDLRQIQSALELYRSDQGEYPKTLTGGQPLKNGSTIYMSEIPSDPNFTGSGSNYKYAGQNKQLLDGTDYTLSACLENSSDSQGKLYGECGIIEDSSCATKVYFCLNNP